MDQKKNEQRKSDQVDSSGSTKNTSTQTILTGRHPETTLRQAANEYLQARIAYDREQTRDDKSAENRRSRDQEENLCEKYIEDVKVRHHRLEKLILVERQRQCEIDDEIQKLMCFLPNRRYTQKLSRNQILKELYEVALEELKDEHVKKPDTEKPSTSGQPSAQPSNSEQVSISEQPSISDVQNASSK